MQTQPPIYNLFRTIDRNVGCPSWRGIPSTRPNMSRVPHLARFNPPSTARQGLIKKKVHNIHVHNMHVHNIHVHNMHVHNIHVHNMHVHREKWTSVSGWIKSNMNWNYTFPTELGLNWIPFACQTNYRSSIPIWIWCDWTRTRR